MTIEEAIRRIKDFGLHHAIKDLPYSILIVEAFEMAIRSLESWKEVKEEITNNNIADFIAVQSVLDIIDKHTKEIENDN